MGYRTYTEGDEAGLQDGDMALIGVNDRLDPSQLGPGFCARAVNLTFRSGTAEPRRGIVPLAFTNRFGAYFPWVWPVTWNQLVPFARIYGVGIFSDPNGEEWIIVAAEDGPGNGKVFRTREGSAAREIALPAGVVITADVTFTQCFNELIMFRGPTAPELRMVTFDAGFTTIVQTANTISGDGTYNPGDGTLEIPNASRGIFFANRLLVPHGRDLVAASDYLNYTRFQPTLADFRINQGSSDRLVALYKFNDSTVVCFKDHSVWQVGNVYGDLSELRQDSVTSEYGLAAAKSVVSVGSDVWFLSERGVASVAQTSQNKLQGTDGLVSKDIEGTIQRINWRHAWRACAIYHGDRFYLAVPLDDAQLVKDGVTWEGVNNAIIVYDFLTGAWSGVWTGQNVMVHDFIAFNYGGKKTVGFVSDDGFLCALNMTVNDLVPPGAQEEIATEFVSRAYKCEAPGVDWKRFTAVELDLATHGATYSVGFLRDGYCEAGDVVTDRTKSRTRYIYPWNKAAWDPSNVNDDFCTPGREDYAVELSPPMTLGSNGVQLEQVQATKERFRVGQNGRSLQVTVTGSAGRTTVRAVRVEARAGSRAKGVLA